MGDEPADPAVAGLALALLAQDADEVGVDGAGSAGVRLRRPGVTGADLDGALDPPMEPGERVWVGVHVGGERSASAVVWIPDDLTVGCRVFHGEAAVLECAEQVREIEDMSGKVLTCNRL